MPLLSLKFLLLAGSCALVLSSSRGRLASLFFLGANLAFVWSYLQDPVGLASTLGLCAAGWGLAMWVRPAALDAEPLRRGLFSRLRHSLGQSSNP